MSLDSERILELERTVSKLSQKLKAQREASAHCFSTLDLQEVAIHIIDFERRILFFNSYFRKWCGNLKLPLPKNPVGESIFDIFPFLGEKQKREYDQVFDQGTRMTSEEQIELSEGFFVLDVQKIPVFRSTRVMEVITIITDVTVRWRAEEELKSSQERFKLIFEYAPDGYYLSDLKGTFLDGNLAAEKISGYSRNELIGKNFLKLNLLPKEQLPRAASLLVKNALGNPTGPEEFTFHRTDTGRVQVEIATYPIKIRGKTQVLGIARDITARKQAEDREKRYIRELEILSIAAMNFVKMTAEDDIFTEIAEQLQKLVGDSFVVTAAFDQKTNALELKALAGVKRGIREILKIIGGNPVGMKFFLTDLQSKARIHSGKLNRVSGGLYEITQHQIPKTICDTLEKTFGTRIMYSVGFKYRGMVYGAALIFLRGSEELDSLEVIETFIHQASVALQKWIAERMIVSSLKEKEVLLKEVHHRVKNNMQVISSLVSLQARLTSDPAVREALHTSRNRIRSMALIHENLYQSKDFSRIDFSSYLKILAAYLLRSVPREAQSIRLVLPENKLYLNVNTAIPCGLIVNELIVNSIRHAFPGGAAGTVSIDIRKSRNGAIQIRVADDGVGYPPGWRGVDSHALGLQLVFDLVKQIDGRISLRKGKGVAYTIKFQA